jgi:hypothetical protein
MSTPSSNASDDSTELEIEFTSVAQVKELYEKLCEKYDEVQAELEMYESIDDDIQELREKTLDKYEFEMLAQVYEALGENRTYEGLMAQAEECDERIEELQETVNDLDALKDHFFDMYQVEMKKESIEIQMKACEKYLEKTKNKKMVQDKRSTLRPASPRRYPKAASPSRLAPMKERTPTPPRKPEPVSLPISKPVAVELPKVEPLPLPPPPPPSSSKTARPTMNFGKKTKK